MEVSGNDAEQFLETILVSDLQKLKKGHGKQSSNDRRYDDDLYVCV